MFRSPYYFLQELVSNCLLYALSDLGGGEAYRELQENILSQIPQWAHMHCQLRPPSRFWCRAGFGNLVVVGFVNVGLAATVLYIDISSAKPC